MSSAQDNPAALSRRARDAMLAGHYQEAIHLYEQMVKAVPEEPRVRLDLAVALDAAGRHREALKNLEAIRTAEAANSLFWFLLGIEYQKLQQPASAVGPLERAVKLEPPNEQYCLELADAYLASGASAQAEAAFRRLSNEKPDNAKALEGLALSLLAMSHEAYNALEQVAPRSSFQFGLAALAEAEKGNNGEAASLYRRAMSAQPPAPWLRTEFDALNSSVSPPGLLDAHAWHLPEEPAARAFLRGDLHRVVSLTAGSKRPEALYWRARACSQLAKSSLVQMAALPPNAEVHELLARPLREAGRWEESIAELREAHRMSPGDNRLTGELAEGLWLGRHYDEAARILSELVKADPERAGWQFQLGDSLFNLGEPEQALTHLRLAVELSPSALLPQAVLGRILLQMGDDRRAVPHLQKALSLDQDGSIHYQLATAYRNLGKTDLARQALARQKELQKASRRRAGVGSAAQPLQ